MPLYSKKRILITSRFNGAGGIETHILNLCRVLVGQGTHVTIASRVVNPATPLAQVYSKIPVQFISTPFAHDVRYFRLSTAWAVLFWPLQFQFERFDVLYTFEFSRFTRLLSRFLKPGGYVVGNCVGDFGRADQSLGMRVNQCLNGLIVESNLQAEAAKRLYDLKVPLRVIPLLGHYNIPASRQLRHGNRLRVAFLGRYDRDKGIYRILEIWPQLAIQSAQLDFYGSGPERTGLQEAIRQHGLQEQVFVNGGWVETSELSTILSKTDLVVLPSETEGLPVVLLEAMAHGVPFVASDVGAVRTLAENNPDVQVVPLDNTALKEAIEYMAQEICAGGISGERLQEYHRSRYGFELTSSRWLEALLLPEQFWGDTRENTDMGISSPSPNSQI